MDLINETGLEVGWIVEKIVPPSFSLTAIVKGTFKLKVGEPAVLDEEQFPLTGDEFEEGNPTRPIRYASDFAPFKPRADILLCGQAFAPDDRPVTSLPVSIHVGRWRKRAVVFGDRYWRRDGSPSPPVPFVRMPLTWEKAYGGPAFAANPLGKGANPIVQEDGQSRLPLPNIELAGRPASRRGDVLEPAAFGPIANTWPQRLKKFGHIDEQYLKARWPWYPASMDWQYFNCAPEDQQFEGYLQGNENLDLEHLLPRVPDHRSFLPGIRVRCFLNELVMAHQELREVPMHLDTLWVAPEEEKLVLVWRGHLAVKTQKLSEVFHLFAMTESIGESPKEREEVIALLHDAIVRAEAGDEELEAEAEPEEDETEEMETGEGIESEAATEEAHPVGQSQEKGDQGEEGKTKSDEVHAEDEVAEPVDTSSAALSLAGQESSGSNPAPKAEGDERVESEGDVPVDDDVLTAERVKEMIAMRASFRGTDLSGLELSACDFSGLDLQEVILERAVLVRAKLVGTDLSGAVLGGANLREADCTRANFAGADMTGACLTKANLTGANLCEADLSKVCLRQATLSGAQARDAVFEEADLSEALVEDADLAGSDLCRVRVHHTRFGGANLAEVALEGAWGREVYARRANMTKVRGAQSVLCEADFRGIEGTESVWEGAQLHGATYVEGRLNSVEMSEANLERAAFEACEMKYSRLNQAILRTATMRRANLFAASLDEADLTGADLMEANLYGATLMDATMKDTRLGGANLRKIKAREEVA